VDLLTWLELNRNALVLGVAVVAIGVAALLVVRHRQQEAFLEANTRLLQLTPPTRGADAATPPKAADLLAFAAENTGRPAAERARFIAAGRLFAEGKYADARTQFEQIERDSPEGLLASTAALGIASSLDAENKTNEAMAAYQRVITAFKDEPAAVHAKLARARLYEAANQPKEALALYDELGKNQASMFGLQSAMMARAQLLTAHPELDQPLVTTNAVNVLSPAALTPAK
jgi:predicted negative regulator of RcsB-dependent stress response